MPGRQAVPQHVPWRTPVGGWGCSIKRSSRAKKNCGDALIPDAHLAWDKLDLHECVEATCYPAVPLTHLLETVAPLLKPLPT